MSRFFYSVILLLAGSVVSLNAQISSFWRLTYGDTCIRWLERPEVMNLAPIQGDWSLAYSKTYTLNSGHRLIYYAYDVCDWKSPNEMTASYSTTLIDLLYCPWNRNTFDADGRHLQIVRYGSAFDDPLNGMIRTVESWSYNPDGQITAKDYSTRSYEYGFLTDAYEMTYTENGDLLQDTCLHSSDSVGPPITFDSVAYVYDDERKLTDRSNYSGIKGEPLTPKRRISYSYDLSGRVSEERWLTWMPETNSWFTEKLIDYQYENLDRLSQMITSTYDESGLATLNRLLYTYSDDGLETIQTGHLFQDTVWMDNYYLREVRNERGQPVVIEEFHRDSNGDLYVQVMGGNHGFSRIDTDLRGRCIFAYDENGLLKSFSNYSNVDQPDSLPNLRKEFYWEPRFSGKDDVKTISEIRIYPNPSTDQITILLPDFSESEISIEILDSTGKVQTGYAGLLSGTEIQLPVTNLAPGIYFARIVTDGKVNVVKLIKN